jgi:long-chain acyl-CoA synthetase
MSRVDNLARMFWQRVQESGGADAQMVKRAGVWRRLTWTEVGNGVREIAVGLLALEHHPGDAVGLLSTSRAEWVQTDFAILSTGGVTVPIYATYTPEQIAYIVNDAEVRMLIVENASQLARVLAMREKMPRLQHIVVIDDDETRGAALTGQDLRRLGRDHASALERALAERVSALDSADVATIVYTSGTTGEPKGVVQTHANHMATLAAVAQIPGVQPGDVHLLFLPLAHSFARLEAFMGVHRGLVTAFAESVDALPHNLREVRPDFVFGVPRVYEKAQARIQAAVEVSPPVARRLFAWALRVGRAVSRYQQKRQPVPARLALAHRVARRAVFSKLHEAFGGRLRFAVSGGAPLSQETAEFFHAAGILIVEGYGLTEACPALTFNRIDFFKFGSVGQTIPGVELRLAADGEILARGPNIATRGYWRKPEATAETFGTDGWLRTGDIGRIDEDGFVYITDRKKEIIVTSGGANIAPQYLERLLRTDPLISHAMVYGDRRPYPTALVTLNPRELTKFAREHGILVTDAARLAEHPLVVARVGQTVDVKNAELQSYARIKRFAVLPADFTEETGELTPTQKVKRKVIAEKYRTVIEALYRPAAP